MRNRFVIPVAAMAALLLSTSLFAQNAQRGKAAPAPPSGPAPSKSLAGVWRWTGRAVLTVSAQPPQFTPLGKSKFDANKPSYGERAVPPATGNDPQGKCDPLGIPRLLFYGGTTAIEILQERKSGVSGKRVDVG